MIQESRSEKVAGEKQHSYEAPSQVSSKVQNKDSEVTALTSKTANFDGNMSEAYQTTGE